MYRLGVGSATIDICVVKKLLHFLGVRLDLSLPRLHHDKVVGSSDLKSVLQEDTHNDFNNSEA